MRRRFCAAMLASGALALLLGGGRIVAQGDTQPPALGSRSPLPGATGVSTQGVVKVSFTEPVVSSSVAFSLKTSAGVVVPATITYDDLSRSATLAPVDDLAGASVFTASVSATDLAGNTMPTATWSFTTATPSFQQSIVFSGLTEPTAVEFASDGRVFVAEKSGIIKVFASLTATTPTVFADLRTSVYNYGDRGLLGLALHPSFPTVPYVYALYTVDADIGGTPPKWGSPGVTSDPCPTPPGPNTNGCVASARLVRLQASGDVMIGNEQVMIHDWFQQFPSHSVGSLIFDDAGALYASAGESASYDFADYGQAGIPLNPGGDPPVGAGGTQSPATSQGGSLRAQDMRTSGDPQTLDGTVIRIDPETAAAPADNPLFSNPDPNARRVIAYGLRNPFRMAARPGTREIWIGDVGWNSADEINRITDTTDSIVENFGWPCYEGDNFQWTWWAFNNGICQQLYAANTAVPPVYSYANNEKPVNDSCPTGSTSTSGLAFYQSGNYPSSFRGALFFADYSRNCIWVMFKGSGNAPDPAKRASFLPGASNPVQLKIGPGGDLFYVDLAGTIRRVKYFSGNQPPHAAVQAAPSTGSAPLQVTFDASGSSDPDAGDTLSYAWDLNGDGVFNDATGAKPTFSYTAAGPHVASVQVTDSAGLSDSASITVLVDASYPTASITDPSPSMTWKVGDLITFSGTGTDQEDGALPPSAMTWNVIIHHCPGICHTHPLQTIEGVSSGSFAAPDHEYPAYLELQLAVHDSTGLVDVRSVNIYPRTVDLTFTSVPSGLQLGVGSGPGTTPFTRTVIAGSANSIGASSPQGNVQFVSWSDGGAQSHNIVAPASAATFTANFATAPLSSYLVAAYDFNDGSGTTAADRSGNGRTGTLSGASWSTSGKFGGALSFNGTNNFVTVADANALDVSNQMTLEAWVNPAVSTGGRRTVLFKENGTTTLAYALYARDTTNRPVSFIVATTSELSAAGSAGLPVNTWTHLAATYDGTTLRTYVNGAQVGSRAIAGAIVSTTGSLKIGGNAVRGEYFSGRIDEIRIYAKALTAAEIAADMTAPITPPGPDTTPPTVSVTSPVAGNVAGTFDLVSSASDNVGVTGVQFKVDNQNVGAVVAAAPYRLTWDSTTIANGPHTIAASAADAAGNSNVSAPVAVTVKNDLAAPVVGIDAPQSGGTVGGTIAVSATATDDIGVTSVQFLLDGVNLGAADTTSPFGVSWNTTGATNGSHTLTAVARDAAGHQTASAPISVTVFNAPPPPDTTPPTVSLTSPANAATVSGTISVTANASDNAAVAQVQFRLNGVNLGVPDTAAPYSVSWDTTTSPNGTYSLTAIATDASGNPATSATVTATVSNVVVTGGLVAAYGFNETSGTSAADAAGNGRTGTVAGAAWTASGRFGGALSFNGTSARVNVSDANSLDLTNGMTLEAWIYPTALSAWRTVILKENGTTGLAYALYAYDNAPRPAAYINAGGGDVEAMGTAAPPLNTWSHVAATYDGTTLRIYVNGTQVGTRAIAGNMVVTAGALRIGGNAVWGEYFTGSIDEVRVYNRALTATELQSDMTKPVGP